jgi:hypothetical protein
MSLLSIDITKSNRLSFKEVTLSPPEEAPEPVQTISIAEPPKIEDIAYTRLVAINPLIEELVETLDLVSYKTGERIKKLDLKELAEKSYSKETLINWIMKEYKVNRLRAEKGFIYMLEERIIEETIDPDLYYLTGSTPF